MDLRPSLPSSPHGWTPRMNPAFQPDGPFAQCKQLKFQEELESRLEELDETEGLEIGNKFGMQPVSTLLEAEVHEAKLMHLRMTIQLMH